MRVGSPSLGRSRITAPARARRNGYFYYSRRIPGRVAMRQRFAGGCRRMARSIDRHRSAEPAGAAAVDRSRSRREAASPHRAVWPFRAGTVSVLLELRRVVRRSADRRLREAELARSRRTEHIDDRARPFGRPPAASRPRAPALGAEAAELLRQPPGRLAAGRTLQRLRGDRAPALRASSRRRRRRRARADARPARAGSLRRAGA